MIALKALEKDRGATLPLGVRDSPQTLAGTCATSRSSHTRRVLHIARKICPPP